MTEPAFTELVSRALLEADKPLTLEEIIERVAHVRPVQTRNPKSTIRNALNNVTLAASLGGRPARYTWWPRHLVGNSFRQPLALSDLTAGTLAMHAEVWMALWPDFSGGQHRSSGRVTVRLAEGSELQAHITLLTIGRGTWGLGATPELAEWYHRQGVTPGDELIVRVLDSEARLYELTLVRQDDRDEDEIATRNRELANAAETVMRTSAEGLPDFYLVPRLIGRDTYHHPLPPDSLEAVLRADLRFMVGTHSFYLAERVVNSLERDKDFPPDPLGKPKPPGNRHRARSEERRREWGDYLFDRGMEHLWQSWDFAATAYYQEALRCDPGHADAWVHLGNRRFEEDRLTEALDHYERGREAAKARTVGDPAHYPYPFWLDVDSRPFMRALNGQGLCLWRLGRVEEARQIFAWMLELNPNDNQGARFVLRDIDAGLSWEESVALDGEQDFPGAT